MFFWYFVIRQSLFLGYKQLKRSCLSPHELKFCFFLFCFHQVSPQDPDRTRHQGLTGSDQDQDQHQHQVLHHNQDQDQHGHQVLHQHQDQSLTTAAGSQVAIRELGGSVPVLVVTQVEKVSTEREKPDGKLFAHQPLIYIHGLQLLHLNASGAKCLVFLKLFVFGTHR